MDGGRRPGRADGQDNLDALDVALGAGVLAARVATTTARPLVSAAAGVLRLSMRLVPAQQRAELAGRGAQLRALAERTAAETLRRLLPRVAAAALDALDVTELVRAHVDLDAVATSLDVDAVVARADLEAIIDRLDIDGIVARADLDKAASRLDVDAVVARADLDRAVARVDVEAIIDRLDLDAVVAKVDLDEIAARIDLDAILDRVDPDAVVARVDVEAVLARLDLAGITRQVLEAVDLAEILRESSGAVSSQAARVVRTESMHADDAVAHWVDRVLRRSHPGEPTPR
ncbi:MAG TPA: hypothetical protein VGN47_02445 [Blastococcus sp.]|nr:hypothetical protein [Blastococcus sp.]